MLAKAGRLGADEIVVDLEDSVPPAAKEHARELVAGFLARENTRASVVVVRINALAGPWGERDVVELARRVRSRIGSLIVPKVERGDQLAEVERVLDAQGEGANRAAGAARWTARADRPTRAGQRLAPRRGVRSGARLELRGGGRAVVVR